MPLLTPAAALVVTGVVVVLTQMGVRRAQA